MCKGKKNMDEHKINNLLNKQKNAELIYIFKYKEKDYVKALKIDKGYLPVYIYFELNNNEIKEIEDKELLNKIRKTNEIHEKRIY